VVTIYEQFAGCKRQFAGNEAQKGRLARTIGPYESDDLSTTRPEGTGLQRDPLVPANTETARHPIQLYDGHTAPPGFWFRDRSAHVMAQAAVTTPTNSQPNSKTPSPCVPLSNQRVALQPSGSEFQASTRARCTIGQRSNAFDTAEGGSIPNQAAIKPIAAAADAPTAGVSASTRAANVAAYSPVTKMSSPALNPAPTG
jgi:hypothetical protein